jgi:hypothetical protein
MKSAREIIGLSFLSALGFLIGEKLLLCFRSAWCLSSVSGIVRRWLVTVHSANRSFVLSIITLQNKIEFPYMLALAVGTIVHFFYNVYVLRVDFDPFLAVVKRIGFRHPHVPP